MTLIRCHNSTLSRRLEYRLQSGQLNRGKSRLKSHKPINKEKPAHRLGRQQWIDAKREAIETRGGRCEYDGCNRTAAHAHHILPKARGGKNVVDNLLLLCAVHHAHIHSRQNEALSAGYLRKADKRIGGAA